MFMMQAKYYLKKFDIQKDFFLVSWGGGGGGRGGNNKKILKYVLAINPKQ